MALRRAAGTALLLVWASQGGPASATTPAELWRGVGLPFDLVSERLTRANCGRDRAHFEACLIAWATVAAAHDPPLLPIPAAGPAPDAGAAPPCATGRFRAVACRPAPGPDAGAFHLEARAAREFAVVDAWATRLGGAANAAGAALPAVDFEGLTQWLRDRIVSPENESWLTARGVSAYLRRVLDPHTAIAPYAAIESSLHRAPRGIPRLRPGLQNSSVTGRRRFAHGVRLGWIEIPSIDDAACVAVSSAILDPGWENVQGLVLDLRGNAGGVADQAACIADLFLPKGTPILRLEPLVPEFPASDYTARGPALSNVPLVLLIDAGTASGAEVIAAALQARGRAWVVGRRSFGKGTYQRAAPWSEHPDVVYYETVARLTIPPGYEFQIHGVLPDFEPLATPAPGVLREENAYVNPIPPLHPPVPRRTSPALEACVAAGTELAPPPAGELAEHLLWCAVSGSSRAKGERP